MTLAQRFGNLMAVPSYHYHPVFAQELRRALAAFKPLAIALEVSELWAEEFEWGISFWPCPMASFANNVFAPIVPGDSMVEACRLGREAGVPIFFVDLALADPIDRGKGGILPDPAFASRIGNLFAETIEAASMAVAPAEGDIARECYMARRLSDLTGKFERVLFVCGMAHWSRIRGRLEQSNFDGPTLPRAKQPRSFNRMRLGATALHRFTQRLPCQVAQFARQPSRYSDSACFSKLALAAVKPEKIQAVEVASMLVYARNLAAMKNFSETPDLWDLLTSSSSVFGNEYASRLATLALLEHFTDDAKNYPLLSYGFATENDGRPVFRCDGKMLNGQPLWASAEPWLDFYEPLPSIKDVERRAKNDPASEVSAGKQDEKTAWVMHPDDEKSYEAFVRYVLQHASIVGLDVPNAVPLTSGMADGIDIRATIQHWQMNEIYVQEPLRASARITNGLIDWTSPDENSWIIQNGGTPPKGKDNRGFMNEGGWIDPSLTGAGSASWEVREFVEVQRDPFWIQRDYRALSLITLDAPTSISGKKATGKSFYDRVIVKLLDLRHMPENNNVYNWLEIMFEFCRNKPFVYYSRYKPSSRILNIGRKFGVSVIHVPLTRIPERMLEQHQSFKFMKLTRAQWEDLLEQIAELKRAWACSNGIRRQDN